MNFYSRTLVQKTTIGVLGELEVHKGANLLLEMCKQPEIKAMGLEFLLFGAADKRFKKLSSKVFRSTGRYRDSDLQKLLSEASPSIMFFPARWPETFSYTLSQAMRYGAPILAARVGAFPERLTSYPASRLFDITSTPKQLVEMLASLAVEYQNLDRHSFDEVSKLCNNRRQDFYGRGGAYFSSKPTNSSTESVRAFVVPERDRSGLCSPCAYIRLIEPLARLQRTNSQFSWLLGGAEEALEAEYDVLITHRYAVLKQDLLHKLFTSCKGRKIPIIYDIDDDLMNIPLDHPEYAKLSERTEVVKYCLQNANLVWVSTSELGESVSTYSNRFEVLRNAVAAEIAPSPPTPTGSAKKIRILVMGTRTHDAGFRMIEPALARIVDRHGKNIEVIVVGLLSNRKTSIPVTYLDPPSDPHPTSYPAFMSWLGSQGPFDIGIAALCDTPFNRCKSDIKYWDYAILGAAPVVSDCRAYAGTVKDGVDGVLVANTPGAWAETLERLINDGSLRMRLQLAALARANDEARTPPIDSNRFAAISNVATR